MRSRKSEGFFRIKTVNGRKYLVKIKTFKDGKRVRHKQLLHVGAIEAIIPVLCGKRGECSD